MRAAGEKELRKLGLQRATRLLIIDTHSIHHWRCTHGCARSFFTLFDTVSDGARTAAHSGWCTAAHSGRCTAAHNQQQTAAMVVADDSNCTAVGIVHCSASQYTAAPVSTAQRSSQSVQDSSQYSTGKKAGGCPVACGKPCGFT